jgi:hypothetical protein
MRRCIKMPFSSDTKILLKETHTDKILSISELNTRSREVTDMVCFDFKLSHHKMYYVSFIKMYSYCTITWTGSNYHTTSVAQTVVCILKINHKRVNCGLGIIPVKLNFIFQNKRKTFSEVDRAIYSFVLRSFWKVDC